MTSYHNTQEFSEKDNLEEEPKFSKVKLNETSIRSMLKLQQIKETYKSYKVAPKTSKSANKQRNKIKSGNLVQKDSDVAQIDRKEII